MSIFAKSTPSKKPRTKDSQQIAYVYIAVLVVFALTQLFTFDKFLVLLEGFSLPGGAPVAHLLGGIIVASEVLALPFLLGFRLSSLMRVFSMVLGWLVPLIWLKLSLWLIITGSTVVGVGFLGTTVDIIPGWWAVFACLSLGLLAAWASWGLWPFEIHKKAK